MRKIREVLAATVLGAASLQAQETAAPADSAWLEGAYVLPGGSRVTLVRAGGSLSFSEQEEGRGGTLARRSDTLFVHGPSLDAAEPVYVRMTPLRDARGSVTGVRWTLGSAPTRVARRIAHRSEEVRYASGGITIAGTLILPATPGPHPAVVLITGSGPALRDQFGGFPYLLASHGIAALVYDKRGNGASTGRFSPYIPIDTLAGDALAGVELLRTRADIDSARIGLRGDSQGGWVAPAVAARTPVAFVILKSGSALPNWENDLYEVESGLRLAGFADADVARAMRLGRMFNGVITTRGEGWAAFRDSLGVVSSAPWFSRARLPESLPEHLAPENLRWLDAERRTMFDPAPVLAQLRVPVLIVNGGRDENVPSERAHAGFRRLLAENRDVTMRLYPEADHWMWMVERMGQREGRARQVPYDALIVDWLRQRGFCRDPD